MTDTVDLLKLNELDRDIQTIEEMAMSKSHHEIAQSLISMKHNIRKCILDLESTIQVKPSLIHSMKNAMKDAERVREAIHPIKNNNIKCSHVDPSS